MDSGSTERLEVHVAVESDDSSPIDLLHRATTLSRQRIKQAMTLGAVWLTRGRKTQRLRRAKRRLQMGDQLHLYYDSSVLSEVPKEPELIADLNAYSVWNKPYGLRSQGSKWGDHCTVVRWAERHLQPQRSAFTVHRLDRAANGLILIAHSKSMAAKLSSLFKQREIEKRYRAVVEGQFSPSSEPLKVTEPIDGKSATSEFWLQQVDGGRSTIDVSIETGRKHQIRRHLAGLGHPIVGDRLYGGAKENEVDLQLTAYLLRFRCPVADAPVEYRLDLHR